MMHKTKRRSFIKKSAAMAAGAFVLPRFSIGQAGPSANSKVNIAMIGAGGIADMAYRGCKGDIKECGSNFDYSAPMTETALLGVLAQRFGGRIEWDPEKGVTNRPELNAFVQEPVRTGWEYGKDLWT
jgi:hypothetical protein